jgi:hypothetical protein
MRFPIWFPNFSAWMSAFFLLLLTGSMAVTVQKIWQFATPISRISPRLSILLGLLGLVLPIIMIAIAHHLLHVFLDRFFPDTRSPEMNFTAGCFPSIMSWWEGLYGWLVLVLATCISAGVLGFLYYSPTLLMELYALLMSWDKLRHLLTLPAVVWIAIAAFLYQFEYLVRQRLIAVGRG